MAGAYRTADATVSARRAAAVTFDDNAIIEGTRGLYVGSSGDLALLLVESAASTTFKSVPAGTILPVQAIKVLSTGTTCTAGTVLALY